MILAMNLQIINDCAGTDPGLPTAGTDPGRRYSGCDILSNSLIENVFLKPVLQTVLNKYTTVMFLKFQRNNLQMV